MKPCTLFTRLALVAGASLAFSLPASSAFADNTRAIVFILDCSKSMASPAVAGSAKEEGDGPPPARMEVAKQTLVRLLEDAAADECQVGLWLYGHRVKWQENVREPELVEQNDYLQASVGFDALGGLLPGDDLECVLPIKPLAVPDIQELDPRFGAVQAWGERPMYATLVRALDDLSALQAGTPKTIVLLTDGGNRQWLAKYKPAHGDVISSLNRQIVPIHVLHFGTPDADEARLKDLAQRGGGSLAHLDANTNITLADVLTKRQDQVATAASAPTGDPAKAEAVAAATALLQGKLPVATTTPTVDHPVTGTVTYYGRPVTMATISVLGTDVTPVKTDRHGTFLLPRVPSGKQTIQINAIAKNAYRDKAVELVIETARAPQPLSVDLSIK